MSTYSDITKLISAASTAIKDEDESRKINKLRNIEKSFNYVEKYGWPKIIHQFTLKILFLIKREKYIRNKK